MRPLGPTSTTLVLGNFIGTNAAGNAAVRNAAVGVRVEGFTGTGADTLRLHAKLVASVLSGNLQGGVVANGAGHILQSNFIGTDASGSSRARDSQRLGPPPARDARRRGDPRRRLPGSMCAGGRCQPYVSGRTQRAGVRATIAAHGELLDVAAFVEMVRGWQGSQAESRTLVLAHDLAAFTKGANPISGLDVNDYLLRAWRDDDGEEPAWLWDAAARSGGRLCAIVTAPGLPSGP